MSDQSSISFFAKTNFRNQNRIFGIKEDDRRRHMYIIGKSGMGKTNLLENLAIQDIKHGKGIAFVDPHGDSAEKLIKAIPSNRINDVIYFNPADQEYPIAFNVMEKVGAEYRHLIASGLIGVFKKLWADSWGPRLEYILRNAILALLEYPGSTLLGVTRILVDKDYRERVVAKVTDPVVRSFWVDEFTKWNDRVLQEVISPIQNKVGAFLTTSLIRNIVGQTVSSFDIRDVMDGEKILILNLSKGRIGEDASALLGAMMITKIQLAAMERVDIPEEDRKDFYLYVDEFQNFATESFANILSEARKYRLNLILANQYIQQIDERVANAIFGNAGTIISFRVGAADAEFLEKEFAPVFTANDLVNLPKYNIYLKLMIDGIAGDAFSATTLPPISLSETIGNEEKVIANSRERYATSKKEVEDKIRRWSGMITEEERLELLRKKGAASRGVPSRVPLSRPESRPASLRKEALQLVSVPVEPEQPRIVPKSFTIKPYQQTLRESEEYVAAKEVAPAVGEERIQKEKPTTMESVLEIPQKQLVPLQEALHEESRQTLSAAFDEVLRTTEEALVQEPEARVQIVSEELKISNETESSGSAEPSEERTMYPAICDTCGAEIRVPFEPDGKRPTFCKDCFKDYQRALANAKNAHAKREQRETTTYRQLPERKLTSRRQRSRRVEADIYVPTEAPLSLSQATLVAPKKFRSAKKVPDLGAVRDILSKSRKIDAE